MPTNCWPFKVLHILYRQRADHLLSLLLSLLAHLIDLGFHVLRKTAFCTTYTALVVLEPVQSCRGLFFMLHQRRLDAKVFLKQSKTTQIKIAGHKGAYVIVFAYNAIFSTVLTNKLYLYSYLIRGAMQVEG